MAPFKVTLPLLSAISGNGFTVRCISTGLEMLMPTAICPDCQHEQSLDAAEWTGIEYQAMCEKCGAQLKGLLLPSGARPQSLTYADDWLPVKHID
jgi:predicted amidophosphoribosyltransferase